MPAVDWRRCPEAGEDAGAPRVGLSRLKLVANPSDPRRLERVQETHIKIRKVGDIASHDRQLVDNGRCRNHGVLVARIRLSVHQSSPRAQRLTVHWQDAVRGGDKVGPCLYLGQRFRACKRKIFVNSIA